MIFYKKGTEAENQMVKIGVFIAVLLILVLGIVLLFNKEALSLRSIFPSFGDNETVIKYDTVGYDVARVKLQYFDGREWFDFPLEKKVNIEGKEISGNTLTKYFNNYYFGIGEASNCRDQVDKKLPLPDAGEIIGLTSNVNRYGEVEIKMLEKDELSVENNLFRFGYYTYSVDGILKKRETKKCCEENFFTPSVAGVNFGETPPIFHVMKWVIDGETINKADSGERIRIKFELVERLKEINGLSTVNLNGGKSYLIQIKESFSNNNGYLSEIRLNKGYGLKLYDGTVEGNYLIYRFFYNNNPIDIWNRIDYDRKSNNIKALIWVPNEEGKGEIFKIVGSLKDDEKRLVEHAKKWRDELFSWPIEISGSYYCVTAFRGGRISVKLDETVAKDKECSDVRLDR